MPTAETKIENPMEVADAWLVHDEKGSNIRKTGVTPMEVMFLNTSRKRHKDDTEPKVIHIHNVRTIDRSNTAEKDRLLGIYGERDRNGDLVLEKVLPGMAPQAPTTFKAAKITVDNTEPKSNEKKLYYPEIAVQEAIDDFKAAQQTESLNDDVAALMKLSEAQAAQITQLIKLVEGLTKK